MADGKIIINTRINTSEAIKDAKTLKYQAAKLAAEYRKQGLSVSEAVKKAWIEIERTTEQGAKKSRKVIQSEFSGAIASLRSTVSRLGGMLMSAVGTVGFIHLAKECIELGSAVSEVQNVVDTAFGALSYKIEAFADSAITGFGMSELAAKKTGSTFMAMAKGIGLAEDAASDMAISLTGLSGDVASFFNISQDEAATKLKSVFTGETETLKELGVVMTQVNLEQYALTKGINKSISSMNQAELAMLRYNFALDSLNLASGDFVKTQDSWANQTRILSMQIQQLGANIGQILTTVLLPAIKTLNEIVASLVSASNTLVAALSSLFGVQVSQNTAIKNSADEAAKAENNLASGIEAAAKAAQKSLAPFDELTILQRGTDEGGSSVGGGFDISTNSSTTITPAEGLDSANMERVAQIIKEIAGYIPVIAAGLAGLKLGSFLADLLTANIEAKTLKETLALLGKKALITIEIALVITSAALFIKGIKSAFEEGLNSVNFVEILGSGSVLAGSLSAVLGQIAPAITIAGKTISGALLGGAIGGIITGIPTFVVGIYDAIVSEIDWLNSALIGVGATAAGAGIGAIIGSLGGPIGTGIGALIGLAVGLLTDLIILIVQKWDEVCAFFTPAVEWFDVNVIQPLGVFFSGLWEGISTAASNCWAAIVEFFTPAVEWFSELFSSIGQTISDVFYNIGIIASGCWEIIKTVWARVSEWFNTNVIRPVAEFFSGLWDGFLEKAQEAWEGVKTVFGKVASFFGDTFKKAWEGVVKVFSAAGEIFVDIKDAIVTAFKFVVNGIIKGLNSVIAIPFNGINSALEWIRDINIAGITPFSGLTTISVPQIPLLAQGAVLPPNKPFMAVVGDQKHGTNIEAPLSTIQEAVALVMEDQFSGMMRGFEETVAVLREILEAVYGIHIGDDVIAQAVQRYNRKMNTARGGA